MLQLRRLTLFAALCCAVPQLVPCIASAQAVSTVRVTGTATDIESNPIANVKIDVSGPATASTTTDATGTFALSLAPGVYTFKASKNGFQAYELSDVAVASSAPISVKFQLVPATSQSLQVIGHVSTSTGRQPINTSSAAVSVLGGNEIASRQTPDLNLLVSEIPGVTLQRGGNSPNYDFVVRGALTEANTAIDGHIVRAGNFGAFLTSYLPAQTFGSVEVTKGPGQFGPTSGDSVFGTVNLRLPDFSAGTSFSSTFGYETSLDAPYSSYVANIGLLDKNKLQLVLGYNVVGTNRPGNGTAQVQGISSSGSLLPVAAYAYDFSSPLLQRSEVARLRYNFSPFTSLSVTGLGVQGAYRPQAGVQSTNLGSVVLAPCNPAPGSSVCNQFASYNPPYLSGAVGSTVTGFSFNPASQILDNEPTFEGEFRTTIGNDTLLIRPAATLVNREIDGGLESTVPGLTTLNGSALPKGVASGAWYRVTNPADCQAVFVAPNATSGAEAKGPCFQGSNLTAYRTSAAPCSAANPCYAAVTTTNARGDVVFGSPFLQEQVDRTRDFQVLYDKPFARGHLDFGFDNNTDDNYNLSGDPTAFSPNVNQTVGSSPLSYPRAISRRNDLSISGVFEIAPNLQLTAGDYYTGARLEYSIVDPAQLAAAGGNTSLIPFNTGYLSRTQSFHHNDPQVGVIFRPSSDSSVRFSAGSSYFVPYIGLLGGKPRFNPIAPAGGYPTESFPNPNLQGETTVAYDLGFDLRSPRNILSVDFFDNAIHNKIASSAPQLVNSALPAPIPSLAPTQIVTLSTNINAPIQRSYGVELTLDGTQQVGFGYRLTSTFERAYYDLIPLSFYANTSSTLINGLQIPNLAPFAQAYAELNYHDARGFEFLVGTQYYGNNNQLQGPAYYLVNSDLRIPIFSGKGRKITIGFAGENLTNYNGLFLGGAQPNGTGFATFQAGPLTSAGTLPITSSARGLLYQSPRTFRLLLTDSFDFTKR